MPSQPHILALAGGVGGAKLADGLAQILAPDALTVAVNTGDDFRHLGLHVSPDIDTVMYTLSGRNNRETGWGLAGESWNFMDALAKLGGETWFRLGDRDLATHVERTRRLAAGESLSGITDALCRTFGVAHRIVPMSDQPVRTMVRTSQGVLPFQVYFVRRQCEPAVTEFNFDGAAAASPAPGLNAALEDAALGGIVVCPSNPYVSIDPILAVTGVRRAMARHLAPVIAVSPIIGGEALKGPAAKMMAEMEAEVSATGIARHYGALLDGFVIDRADAALAEAIEANGPRVLVAETIMRTRGDRARLAREILEFARKIREGQ